MRKILFLFLMLAFSNYVKAEDYVLQVWLSDGKVVTINLNEEPVTTYADGQLTITTNKTTVTYPLEKVMKYTYDSATGIDLPDVMNTSFSQDGETITFKGLPTGTSIAIYSAAGQLVRTLLSSAQPKTVVSVSDLPIGVYVVKVNGITYKITKR